MAKVIDTTLEDYRSVVVVARKKHIPETRIELTANASGILIRQVDTAGYMSEQAWNVTTARTLARHLLKVADLIEHGENMIEEVA